MNYSCSNSFFIAAFVACSRFILIHRARPTILCFRDKTLSLSLSTFLYLSFTYPPLSLSRSFECDPIDSTHVASIQAETCIFHT